jgi:hypothetical protein
MHYIDYLKIYIKVYAWGFTAIIVTYSIVYCLGLRLPIPISIGTIIANFIIPMTLAPLWHWYFDSLKK